MTHAYFKFTLRQCCANEDRAQADSLAHKIMLKETKDFWKEIKRLNGGSKTPLAFIVDSATEQKDICDRDTMTTSLILVHLVP